MVNQPVSQQQETVIDTRYWPRAARRPGAVRRVPGTVSRTGTLSA
jgi:hypothetical protein